ncbi:MAG: glycine zipper 2TM domain-containing protein [Phenylobacterium sp.]
MRPILALSAAAMLAAPMTAVPQFAAAQSVRDYGSGDICRSEQRRSANTGTVIGGLAGAAVGRSVAADNARTEGTLLGAAVGAVAGHQIGKSRVNCTGYPRGVSARSNCRWVQEYYGGRNHDFEVCRGRDGVWRPSGRG